MSNKPIISVLMPVYNAEKYLSEAIESILAQTFRDFELITVNDGSTDCSESILRDYQRRDQRIRIISRSNTGVTVATNEALSYAHGRYIALMDADDIALPERFAKQFAFLENNPNHVAVGSRVLMIDPEGLPVRFANELVSHKKIDNANMSGLCGSICNPSTMLRHDVLRKIGGYHEEMHPAQDTDMFLRLAEVGSLANLSDVLLKYRLHLNSMGHSGRTKQWQAAVLAIKEAHRRRGLSDLMDLDTCDQDESSVDEIHSRWAWWSLSDGNVVTARKHALLALRSNPFSAESWKVFACAARGW